jgi:hypothetical protein
MMDRVTARPTPVPLPRPFVVKNGVKNSGEVLAGNAHPGVADANPHSLLAADGNMRCRDPERATADHRVARIRKQIDEDLYELPSLNLDLRQFRSIALNANTRT